MLFPRITGVLAMTAVKSSEVYLLCLKYPSTLMLSDISALSLINAFICKEAPTIKAKVFRSPPKHQTKARNRPRDKSDEMKSLFRSITVIATI